MGSYTAVTDPMICASGTFDDPSTSYFQSARTEIWVDRPASAVWSVLVDLSYPTIKAWNPTVVTMQHLSGEPGQENELVLVTKNTSQPPFYMRTIRLVPHRQRVLWIKAIDGSFINFVDHSLYEEQGRTKMVYSCYTENRHIPADRIKGFDYDQSAAELMDYLNNGLRLLKQLIEERP